MDWVSARQDVTKLYSTLMRWQGENQILASHIKVNKL